MKHPWTLVAAWLVLCGTAVAAETSSILPPGQWTPERAWAWYSAQPWLVGCNFLPSTAVNDVEMWQGDTFDADTIDRELGWAREVGFNTVRVFLNYVVWEADAPGLKRRFRQFLDIAAKHDISVMPVLFDDCNFAGREAQAGPQPDPVPGVHNSQWVSSPPLKMVTRPDTWTQLQPYVRDILGTFGSDRRVIVWDLYNEPGNSGMGERSLPLVEAAFAWAREARPDQPLTVGVWTDFSGEMSQRICALSDVVSFHSYTEVVPTARHDAVMWRYTLEDPGTDWFRSDFDAADWRQGAAPFGRSEPHIGRASRTEWTTNSIWLRREFTLPAGRYEDMRLIAHFDEDAEVYFNGVLAVQLDQWSDSYRDIPLSPDARRLLKEGRNTMAVRCRQTWGGQFIDVGIGVNETSPEMADGDARRWSVERAWGWYDSQLWPCGFNYVPANAISYTEMWMDYGFDPELIDRELKLAQELGLNCVRVVLPFVVWEADPAAFQGRLETFVDICGRHGIRVMFTLFDDCVFGPIHDPVFGKQPDVVEGWYANGWTPSPGHSLVRDPSSWPRLEQYVKDVMTNFQDNPHVWIWDLYNEPTNSGLGDASLPLVEKVFAWAREVNPAQPLTVGQWNGHAGLNDIIFRHSDVITFHDYGGPTHLAGHVADLKRQGRPLICTEWLNRGHGSTVADCLPIFRRRNVGCLHWGLVNGKTQTHLNWGHRPGDPDPPVWQHDLFRFDHTPYEPNELELFRSVIQRMPVAR